MKLVGTQRPLATDRGSTVRATGGSLPAWAPPGFTLANGAAGVGRILDAQGKPIDPSKTVTRILIKDADLTFLKTTVGLRLVDPHGKLVVNPDTGQPIVYDNGGNKRNGDDVEALKRKYPGLPWSTFKPEHSLYDSPDALLSTAPIDSSIRILKNANAQKTARAFVNTARWDDGVVDAINTVLERKKAKVDGVIVANSAHADKLGLGDTLTNPQRKALFNAALIFAHDPTGRTMRNVTFIDDNDENLKCSMEVLPKLFPHINFEFLDVVHKGNGHFEHRLVAKSGRRPGELVGSNGATFVPSSYASNDARFDGSPRR